MEFFSTLIWTPRNTFSETAVAVKNATRLKLKWVPSCCGLKQAEATSITTKEPFVPGTERWKLISPARGIHWDSVGEGRGQGGPHTVNSATHLSQGPRDSAASLHCRPSSRSWLLTESGSHGLSQNTSCKPAEFCTNFGGCPVWLEKAAS